MVTKEKDRVMSSLQKLWYSYAELWLSLLLTAVVCFILFRPIITDLSGQLYDWNDYPLMVWIMDQHLDHWQTGEWGSFFQSNIFAGNPDSLLFTDLLLPSAAMGWVISWFTPDRIATFNLVFLLTWLLNAVAAWQLWRKLWRGPQLVLAAFVTTFMPFVVVNTSHYQMITIWPFLLGLSQLVNMKMDLFTGDKRLNPTSLAKSAFWLGIWISITFVSSVYLAVFLMYCIGIWTLVQLAFEGKQLRKNWRAWALWMGVLVGVVAILAGPFAYKYYQVKSYYQVDRPLEEYINYSAGILDYFSNAHYWSILTTQPQMQRWNTLIATSAGGYFPGFVLTALAGCSLMIITKRKPVRWGVGLEVNRASVFFLVLLLSGVLFSLGPRLRVGAVYVGPPLPYAVLLKFVPLFEPVRAVARWSFLVSLGMVYFAMIGLERLLRHKQAVGREWLVVVGLLLVFSLELLPLKRPYQPASPQQHIEPHLAELCSIDQDEEGVVLLEYPFTYNPYGDARGIFEMLQHWTGVVLDATSHNCRVINGYSGFFPPEYQEYEAAVAGVLSREAGPEVLEDSQSESDSITYPTSTPSRTAVFRRLLNGHDVGLLRVHTAKLTATESATLQSWAEEYGAESVFNSDQEVIYAVQ